MIQDLLFNEYAGRGITLQTDDGTVECQVFTVFRTSVESEQRYIALIEISDEHSNRLLLYRFSENENGPSLDNIDNEDEYSAVTSVLNEYMEYLENLEHKIQEEHECGCGCGCSEHEHEHSHNHSDSCDCGSCH